MNDLKTIRGYFEEVSCPNFSIGPNNCFRKPNGEYVDPKLEDHWQTFQEGWASAVEYLLQAQNES